MQSIEIANLFIVILVGTATNVLLNVGESNAALPDRETYDFITSRYSQLIGETRSGCGYYANLKTLSINGNERAVSVLLTRGQSGGSACNGVFEFQVLQVRCQTEEIAYLEQIGSPATWEESWYPNAGVAQQICSISPEVMDR